MLYTHFPVATVQLYLALLSLYYTISSYIVYLATAFALHTDNVFSLLLLLYDTACY